MRTEEERKRIKPYLDRYYLEGHWQTMSYEEWLKIEMREDILNYLLNGDLGK